jgi:hypothetical protein
MKDKGDLTEQPMPRITKALLRDLDERFPARYPALDWTDREIWYRAGQRAVVEFLMDRFKSQTERGVI